MKGDLETVKVFNSYTGRIRCRVRGCQSVIVGNGTFSTTDEAREDVRWKAAGQHWWTGGANPCLCPKCRAELEGRG